MYKKFKVKDRVRPKKDMIISWPGNKSIRLYSNSSYEIVRTDSKTFTIAVSNNLSISFDISDASKAFDVITKYTFKWTNVYENNGYLKTTILWNTKEEAEAEYEDMKDIHPGVKLVKIRY